MFCKSALATLALASSAYAHCTMYGVWVNGEDQGAGQNTYIRTPSSNSPVKDTTSPDLICNDKGATAVSDFVSAAAGDTLTFEWQHDNRGDDIIADSHKGPIITYVAPYTEGDGAGAVWTKIDEEGYDSSTGQWAVDNLIANKGKKDFTVPSSLAAGKYLFRQEIIGLHEGEVSYTENSARGAQFYPSCVQMEITGSGTVEPNENFDINTGYTDDSTGIVFNIYGEVNSYDIPGPEVWAGSGSSNSSDSSDTPSSPATPASSSAPEAPSAPASSATSSASQATSAPSSYAAPSPPASSATSAAGQAPSAPSPYAGTSPPSVGGGSCKRRKHKRGSQVAAQ